MRNSCSYRGVGIERIKVTDGKSRMILLPIYIYIYMLTFIFGIRPITRNHIFKPSCLMFSAFAKSVSFWALQLSKVLWFVTDFLTKRWTVNSQDWIIDDSELLTYETRIFQYLPIYNLSQIWLPESVCYKVVAVAPLKMIFQANLGETAKPFAAQSANQYVDLYWIWQTRWISWGQI